MNMAIVVAAIGVVAVLVSIVGIATKDAFGDYGNGIIRYLHNSYGGRIV